MEARTRYAKLKKRKENASAIAPEAQGHETHTPAIKKRAGTVSSSAGGTRRRTTAERAAKNTSARAGREAGSYYESPYGEHERSLGTDEYYGSNKRMPGLGYEHYTADDRYYNDYNYNDDVTGERGPGYYRDYEERGPVYSTRFRNDYEERHREFPQRYRDEREEYFEQERGQYNRNRPYPQRGFRAGYGEERFYGPGPRGYGRNLEEAPGYRHYSRYDEDRGRGFAQGTPHWRDYPEDFNYNYRYDLQDQYRHEGYRHYGNTDGFGISPRHQHGYDWTEDDEYPGGHASRRQGRGKYGSR